MAKFYKYFNSPENLFLHNDVNFDQGLIKIKKNLFNDLKKNNFQEYKELSRFIKLPELNFTKFNLDYEKNKKINFFENIYLQDLNEVYQDQKIKNIIKNYNILENYNSQIDLIVNAFYNRSQVLYIDTKNQNKIINLNFSNNNQNIFEKLIIIIKKDSNIKIYNNLYSNSSLLFRSINFILEENSTLSLINYNKTKSNNILFESRTFDLNKNSNIEIIDLHKSLENSFNLFDIIFNLNEKNSNLNYLNLSSIVDNSQTTFITNQNHLSSDSQSLLTQKSTINNNSKLFFSGAILIEKDCSNVCSEQQQSSLLLSPDSKSCAIPSLEIKNNDVTCKHGSATGNFDPDSLFYLSLKGLDQEKSKKILIDGFYLNNNLLGKFKDIEHNFIIDFLDN